MSKILIVEDDLVFARALKNWLEKEHFQVEYATNATRARRMITDNGDADLIYRICVCPMVMVLRYWSG